MEIYEKILYTELYSQKEAAKAITTALEKLDTWVYDYKKYDPGIDVAGSGMWFVIDGKLEPKEIKALENIHPLLKGKITVKGNKTYLKP